ncbi:MAG TPA: ribonuclease H-like domain-containing protein [Ardenticatenaceae bacterium]|nr:ribonuclease H-like domain-containing protein [Ardenticatenaceae bacterium]
MSDIAERRLNIAALRQRLREISPGTSAPAPTPARPAVRSQGLVEVLPGREVVNGAGACYVVEAHYPLDHHHGGVALMDLAEPHGPAVACLAKDEALANFDFRRAVFLDTETNGLAGGAGTYAFLVGLAYFDGDCFQLRQFFLRHPSEERALLAELEPFLARFDGVVSFNGKSFDLPVLETRFILARRSNPLSRCLHLDLLHPARRLWKLRLDRCALGDLERHILATHRPEADIPGWLVPRYYNDYLRSGDAGVLRALFLHNHHDLLALAALSVHMARLCADGAADTEHAPVHHGSDLFSLGRLYEETNRLDEAEAAYRRALRAPLAPHLRLEAVRRLALLLKRQERWEAATAIWEKLLGRGQLFPYEELAKYFEHRSRDYVAAERLVTEALREHQRGQLRLQQEEVAAMRHRLARLRRKRAAVESATPQNGASAESG